MLMKKSSLVCSLDSPEPLKSIKLRYLHPEASVIRKYFARARFIWFCFVYVLGMIPKIRESISWQGLKSPFFYLSLRAVNLIFLC